MNMEKQAINFPKLTKNEETVLRKILEHAKIPDLEIAKKMGLSQQAIFKIRHKLEQVGIIKGYMPIIDFKKIGIKSDQAECVPENRFMGPRSAGSSNYPI